MLPSQIWGHNLRSATIFCTSPEERRSLKIGSFPCGGAGIKGQQFLESSWILLRKVNFRQAPMRPTTLDVEHCSLTSSCLYILLGCLQHLPLCLSLKDVEKKCKWCMKEKFQPGTSRCAWYSANACAITALSLSSSAAETSLSSSWACKWGLALATCFTLADFQTIKTGYE